MLHPCVQKIRSLLDQNTIPYSFFEHAPARTSEEAAALRPEYTLEQGAKALIVKIKPRQGDKFFVMLVMPAHLRFDKEKVLELFGAKSVSFATREEADEITDGIEFGGVPPFGNLFGLEVYCDPQLFEHNEIIFNCGDRKASIAMRAKDYEKVVEPSKVSVT